MGEKINFSSATITYNDDEHLDECLRTVDFCEEKIVVDMGSKDKSVEIARRHGAKIFKHKRVKIPAKMRKFTASKTSNDWIIFIDPDEIFPKKSIGRIKKIIKENPDVGIISLQRVNYFLGKPVQYGRWGVKTAFCPCVLNKCRVKFEGFVHRGVRVKKGFKKLFLRDYATKHYWIDAMSQFWEKHNRYLEDEGRSRYKLGKRFSYWKMFKSLLRLFADIFFTKRGFLDLKNGIKLTYLALWYEYRAWMELKKYEK